jgi:hypothetical protein
MNLPESDAAITPPPEDGFRRLPILIAIARTRLLQGKLPRNPVLDLLAGSGQGGSCAVCDRQIGPAEVEYEITTPAPGGGTLRLYFHVACYHGWTRACSQLAAESSTEASGS